MIGQSLPVTMLVRRSDGTIEQVQVGTAIQTAEGFAVRLGEMVINASVTAPTAHSSLDDLEYYANRARRKLADPSKARWHESERTLLEALEAELARKRGHN